MSQEQLNLRVRINQIDYVLQPPGALDNSTLPRVPVIRVYGESSIGKKACVHVHQAYPYFYLEYTDKMDPEHVNRYITRLSHSLNHAIAISLKRNPNSPNSQFVRAIILVKGVHFYGFHTSYSPFLKVLLADPGISQRAVTLLQSGAIFKTRFRVYESHLSYILQFMSDFGLYGCGWIDLAEIWQRDLREEAGDGNEANALELVTQPSPYHRQTRMPLELDVAAHQILNRHLLTPRNMHHKLTIPAPVLTQEPVVLSVRELWDDERKRRAARGLSPTPVLPKDPSEASRAPGGDWSAEARWWDEIRKRIEKEREQEPERSPNQSWERWVMTTFESVEALWEPQYRAWKPSPSEQEEASSLLAEVTPEENPYQGVTSDGFSSQVQAAGVAVEEAEVDVDEALLSSQEISRIVEREELEWSQQEGLQQDPEAELSGEGMDETALPDPLDDDESTPQASPLRTPSRSAQKDAYLRALEKLTGTVPRIPGSQFGSTTPQKRARFPTEAEPSSSQVQLPASDGSSPISRPVLDENENPFLDEAAKVITSGEEAKSGFIPGILSEDSSENPFLDKTSGSSSPKSSAAKNGGSHESRGHADDGTAKASSMPNGARPSHIEDKESRDSNDLEDTTPRKRRKVGTDTPHLLTSSSHIPQTPIPTYTPVHRSIDAGAKTVAYEYCLKPPSTTELLSSIDQHRIPAKIYQPPFYSIESDAPEHPREYAGLVFHLKGGTGIANLQEWVDPASPLEDLTLQSGRLSSTGVHGWEYAGMPPSVKQVREWLKSDAAQSADKKAKKGSQIVGPTQFGPFGLKSSSSTLATTPREGGSMTALAVEVFAPSKPNRLPAPGTDELTAVFYSFYDSNHPRENHSEPFQCRSGVVSIRNEHFHEKRLREWATDVADSELELINRVIDIVNELDPDILTGWEVQAASWGFLHARAASYGMDLGEQISRAPGRSVIAGTDQWGLRTTSTFKVVGRHVFNLWRIMRSEQALLHYTFENVVFNTLRRRMPRYTSTTLTQWYQGDVPERVSRVFRYFSNRTAMLLEIIEVAELITKTAEFARVFGVDFFSVISRGSQFKVESFMSRIAKPESFVLLSPSKNDVGKQNAAECMPLIMEPISAFYNSPLLVLDFQSLYPSVMIAYNYCYSTCLGRAVNFKGQNKFGVTELHQAPGLLETLKDHINVSPNGMIFVKAEVRKGLLGRMLTELLNTRVMVKQAMKGVPDDKAIQRILNARQLAMKFIANVTYGYTSATFSGRMPAVEIADAIVQTGRETLEKAIRLIDATKKWGAKVVYGDTDSLFIYLPGKTKDQAFRIGNDIADVITRMNPAPIKLKFEKVYLPCVLMAKKRYVGFKYESPDEKEPAFDAKGIETVRRDGVPAQQKMTETCLKILFRTQDLSQVKDYCCTTWAQILENRVSIQDFIFAKEVRMGTYSDKGPPPPGVAVAARRMAEDPNDEPQYGDRIPYVIARGSPGSRLVDRAVPPEDVLNDNHKHLDAAYYISRVLIPPLERIFNLVGADVRAWFDEMPRALRTDEPDSVLMSPRKASKQAALMSRWKIDEHFFSSHCVACGEGSSDVICDSCRQLPVETIATMSAKINRYEGRLANVQRVCASCSGISANEPIGCESLDCPWLYERKKSNNRTESLQLFRDIIDDLEADIIELQADIAQQRLPNVQFLEEISVGAAAFEGFDQEDPTT